MSESRLHVWVHTRGEKWDYRWLSTETTPPPFPGAETGVLKLVAPTQPNGAAAVLVWCDGSDLAIAAGSYTDRRDQHSRRIQQHVVVCPFFADARSASRIAAIVTAIIGDDITLLVNRLINKDLSITELADQISLFAVQNRPSQDAEVRAPLLVPEISQSLADSSSLLCVEPGLSYGELWPRIYTYDQLIRERFYIGSGIADPLPIVGTAGIVSTSKPLLHWGATAGQCILFSVDGRSSLYNYADLPRAAIQGSDGTGTQAFVYGRRHRWHILPAKGSLGKRT
jgi:hypothetical protein